MQRLAKRLILSTLRKFDFELIKVSDLERTQSQLQKYLNAARDLDFILALPDRHAQQLVRNLRKSKSQLRQDLFVLSELEFKRNGFFVEFGATNGVDLSNTHLLEKEFNWKGILAEPAKCWHKDLTENRSAHIETNCVWKDSNSILTFNEVDEAELSTIDLYSSLDDHKEQRRLGNTYSVETTSLNDLLLKYNAPNDIDYLSIDTEGSEFEILESFDFSKHQFKVLTCEHNFTHKREQIFELLTKNGYVRKFEELSGFDDWYVKAE